MIVRISSFRAATASGGEEGECWSPPSKTRARMLPASSQWIFLRHHCIGRVHLWNYFSRSMKRVRRRRITHFTLARDDVVRQKLVSECLESKSEG